MTPIPILLYHSVGQTRAAAYARWCVEPTLFDEHLDALASAGFHCLTVSGLLDAFDAGAVPPRPLVITFDDGRADFVEHAVPALERHGLPATMYVVSAQVGATSAWLGIPGESEQPMMDWDDLRAVDGAGHEIGAHSLTHPELDVLGRGAVAAEVAGSRHQLAAGLGRKIRSFAYPHGYHSSTVVDLTRSAGFDSACAVNDRWSWVGEDRMALSRLVVAGGTSPEALSERLARPPTAPERRSRVLRAGWRGVRWVRRHGPVRAAS